MDPERRRHIEKLYHAVLDQEAGNRAAFLAKACKHDDELRRDVESLLAQDASRDGTLDRTAAVLLSDSPATHLAAGSQLGPYRIDSILGKGGMGTVYRALDTNLNRPVAIKFLSGDLADVAARRRFQREAQMASSLNHPHILTVHDAGEFEGRQYLVTEFVDGGTLRDWAKAEKRTWRQTVELLTDVADGLAAAHAAGMTHRDIKPPNILVAKNGYAKLADFGLAKLTVTTREDVTRTLSAERTRPGLIVGTIAYMSPEQASGRPVDARSDIFSFGVVLYELIAGRRPFAGATDLEELQTIIHGSAPPLAEDVPTALRAVVEKAMEKDPADRFQSVRELVVDLRRLMRQPTEAPSRAAADCVASIAVLPFVDMSAAKDQDWFCDGIAEEILNALTPLKGLKVAARTSAFSFKGKSDDLRTIGEKLKVTTVLEGSVRRAGDRVRITVQLSDVQNGYQLWSERYDRQLKDIFDVQDEIAKAIANRLRVTLGGLKADRLVEQATPNIDAYQLYLKGRALLDRRGASVPAGLQLLQKAAELDPGYSLALAGVADAFTVLAYSGAMRGSDVKREAMTAAARSIELDPTSAPGHNALACATLLFKNNHAIARKEFDLALELNPSYVLARCWYSLLYFQWARGEYEQGIAEARRALDIDPLSAYAAMNLAGCLCTAGLLEQSIETARLSVQLDPESFVARWMLGVSLGMAGGFNEAVSTLEAAAGMSGRHTLALTCLAGVFGQWGKGSEAGALHRELLDRAVRGYIPAAHLAISAEASGQREEAIAFARRAWDEREPPFTLWARHFPQYRSLRADPRFAAILHEMDSS
jgi:serine/threonine protein kinase/tetratricopeptide (TPR) repeat protein